MAGEFKHITADQKEAIISARTETGLVMDSGMTKWEIIFKNGQRCTMLSSGCRTIEAAKEAAIEKFGEKVLCVK